MRGKKVSVSFRESQRTRIFDQDTGEPSAFELCEDICGVVGKELFDHSKEEGNGVSIDTFVNALLAHCGKAPLFEGHRELIEGGLAGAD